jgi:septin family protein
VRQTTEIQTASHGIAFFFFFPDVAANCDTTNVLETRVVITENGVRLRLNIVDTPGYGDQVNNENW